MSSGPEIRSGNALAEATVALRNREFRIFWLAALISNTGGWMQSAAIPFVVYELTGRNAGVPNPTLYWRAGPNFAIRDGDLKMWDVDRADPKASASVGAEVTPDGTKHDGSPFGRYVMVYDLGKDPGEKANLAQARPDLVAALRAKLAAWDKGNVAPQWTSMRQSVRRQDGQLIKLYD